MLAAESQKQLLHCSTIETRPSDSTALKSDCQAGFARGRPAANAPRGFEAAQPWGCPEREERWARASRP
jgi:hypothetical protein